MFQDFNQNHLWVILVHFLVIITQLLYSWEKIVENYFSPSQVIVSELVVVFAAIGYGQEDVEVAS